ncbi:phosphoribosylformylglycinamidine synthase subunit PurS, partial [Candidatus Aerophobetes bacterium]|nr:phosphoribosylformylglycinamidine synthase subunit PurS [Candidatus Aerophobetes bacterium]
MGKYIQMKLNTQDKEKAESDLEKMCAKLLANPVIEDYRYEIEEKWGK